MPDNEETKSIRISKELWEVLKDAQTDARKQTGNEPSFADILDSRVLNSAQVSERKQSESIQYSACSDSGTDIDLVKDPPHDDSKVVISAPQEIAQWVPSFVRVMSGPVRRTFADVLTAFTRLTDFEGGSNVSQAGKTPESSPTDSTKKAIKSAKVAKDAIDKRLDSGRRGPGKRDKTA